MISDVKSSVLSCLLLAALTLALYGQPEILVRSVQ
jgi:hypothetical protein